MLVFRAICRRAKPMPGVGTESTLHELTCSYIGLRGQLLEVARSGDPLAVEEYCAAAVWRWEARSDGHGQAVAS